MVFLWFSEIEKAVKNAQFINESNLVCAIGEVDAASSHLVKSFCCGFLYVLFPTG